jgi:hypothetical protein
MLEKIWSRHVVAEEEGELLLYVDRARASMRRHTTGRWRRLAGAVCRPLCGGGNTEILLAGASPRRHLVGLPSRDLLDLRFQIVRLERLGRCPGFAYGRSMPLLFPKMARRYLHRVTPARAPGRGGQPRDTLAAIRKAESRDMSYACVPP